MEIPLITNWVSFIRRMKKKKNENIDMWFTQKWKISPKYHLYVLLNENKGRK